MPDTPQHAGMPRRDFLKMLPAGAAAMSLAAPGVHSSALPEIGADGRLPVAFCPAGTEAGDPGDAGRVFDAYRLAAGDPRFLATHARLTLHGLYPAEALWEYTAWSGVQIEVVYNRAEDLRQIAWCCENRRVPNIGSASTVRLPIYPDQGLYLAGALRDRDDQRHPFTVQLATGRDAGSAKLRRGLYLAALAPNGSVNWRQLQLDARASEAERRATLSQRLSGGRSGDRVTFPYLAFSVDFAEAAAAS